MSARVRRICRHPRTQQERRSNQGKNDPLVRMSRRANRLSTSYDDFFPRHQKSWKKRREQQWNPVSQSYTFWEFDYGTNARTFSSSNRSKARQIARDLDRLGCFYEWVAGGIRWFGPDVT